MLLAVATVLALLCIADPWSREPRLKIDPSAGALLARDDPELEAYQQIERVFGSDDPLIVALAAEDVFTPSRLARLSRLTERLRSLEFVESVLGLANAPDPRAVADRLSVGPLVPEIPASSAELEALKARVLSHELYGKSLIAPRGQATVILVRLRQVTDAEFLDRGIEARVGEVVAAEWNDDGEEWWLGGGPVIKAATSNLMTADLSWFVPAILVFGSLIFYVAFGTAQAIWLPTLSIAVALVWTLAAMAIRGHAMNLNTMSVPILVMILGYTTLLHMVAEHREVVRSSAPGVSPAELTARALGRIWLPIAMTTLTTAAGFLSLMTSPLEAIGDFGLYSATGETAASIVSLTLVPAVLALSRPRRVVAETPDRLATIAVSVVRFDLRWRRTILTVFAAIVGLAALGAMRISVNMDFVGNFAPGSAVRRHFETANDWFGGGTSFAVIVEGKKPGTFLDLQNLRALLNLGRWLEEQPEIGDTTSLAKVLGYTYLVFRETEAGKGPHPRPRVVIEQLVGHLQRENLAPLVDPEYRRATILIRSRIGSSAEMARLLARMDERLDNLPPPLIAKATGGAVLLARAFDAVSRSQSRSLGFALLAIFAILAVYLRSARLAVLVLVPNVIPVLFCFGLLGWTGVPLNNSTALLACVILGITVDDTVHFLVTFRNEAARGLAPERAAEAALVLVARPVTYATIVLFVGFALLATSRLRMLAEFGALGAASLAFAWLVEIALTPILCVATRPGDSRS